MLSADQFLLERLVGDRATMLLKLAAALSSRRVTDAFTLRERYAESSIKELLVALFRGFSVETLYLLSFDSEDRLIACDFISEGTVNAASVLPRQLLDKAVKNRAVSVAIAHNHPSGVSIPSAEDIDFTKTARAMLLNSDIKLRAHYTVAGSECSSIT